MVGQDREAEVNKQNVVFGMSLGGAVKAEDAATTEEAVATGEDRDEQTTGGITRSVAAPSRVGTTCRFGRAL